MKGKYFEEQAEKFSRLQKVIDAKRMTKGPLIPVMQEAQSIFGYLPLDVQKFIAEQLTVPIRDIYGIATFYSQFSLNPKGKHVVSVCMGTACYVKNSQKVLDMLKAELNVEVGSTTEDGLITLEATRCLGCCGLSPVITVDADVYGELKPEKVPDIIDKYRENQEGEE